MGKEEEKAEGEEGENQYQTQSVGEAKKASRGFKWWQQWGTGPLTTGATGAAIHM